METPPKQESRPTRLSASSRRSYWLGEFEGLQKSGLTLKAYASERGISWYSLRDWRQRFIHEQAASRKDSNASAFREVRVSAEPASYELEFGHGKKLRVSGAFSIERVKQLVELLSC